MVKRDKNPSQKCNIFKKFDIFGYEVSFKYNDTSTKRNSILGGIISIIALTIIMSNGLGKLKKVNSINENDTKISQFDLMVNVNEIKPINYGFTYYEHNSQPLIIDQNIYCFFCMTMVKFDVEKLELEEIKN